MIQAAKIIGTGLATTGLIGAGVGIGVVFGAVILGFTRNTHLLNKVGQVILGLSSLFPCTPKPHSFAKLPLNSILIPDFVKGVAIHAIKIVVSGGVTYYHYCDENGVVVEILTYLVS